MKIKILKPKHQNLNPQSNVTFCGIIQNIPLVADGKVP
jgi:hypothetical protein